MVVTVRQKINTRVRAYAHIANSYFRSCNHMPDINAVPADHLRWPNAEEMHDPAHSAPELAATHPEAYEWEQTGEHVENTQSNYADAPPWTPAVYDVGEHVELNTGNGTWVAGVVTDVTYKAISESDHHQVPHYTLQLEASGEVVDNLLSEVVRRPAGASPAMEAEGHDVDASNALSSNQPADTVEVAEAAGDVTADDAGDVTADDAGDVTADDAGDVTAGDAGDRVPKEEGETPADAVKTEDAVPATEAEAPQNRLFAALQSLGGGWIKPGEPLTCCTFC